jgi:hypothetical protein
MTLQAANPEDVALEACYEYRRRLRIFYCFLLYPLLAGLHLQLPWLKRYSALLKNPRVKCSCSRSSLVLLSNIPN